MASPKRSADFLEINDAARVPDLRRARSGGYVDYLEEKARWDRRDREREMKRYHDNHLVSIVAPRDASDRLHVPTFESTHRRVRSNDEIGSFRDMPARTYNVREVKPAPRPEVSVHDEVMRHRDLPVRRRSSRQKPRIKVEIHQPIRPGNSLPRPTSGKSPSASPRSPSAVPQLLFQYSTLQHKLAQTTRICSPYTNIEAVDTADPTFGTIRDQVRGIAFELGAWSHVARVEDLARIDSRKRTVVEAASRVLDRFIHRVEELNRLCEKTKPRDLKAVAIPKTSTLNEKDSSSSEDEDG